ncbi:hypothetical protein B0T22DRAFT_436127 [Podospora appendiculata]|uniref:Uncharacterized protein n=1 Tax=Podospora appendiculata TaxID=314037 RepID=A0AAE1CG23_9PEZI|nr:hypothetical protein B0T22DRAFT_436127 [Podospora appendiculata]
MTPSSVIGKYLANECGSHKSLLIHTVTIYQDRRRINPFAALSAGVGDQYEGLPSASPPSEMYMAIRQLFRVWNPVYRFLLLNRGSRTVDRRAKRINHLVRDSGGPGESGTRIGVVRSKVDPVVAVGRREDCRRFGGGGESVDGGMEGNGGGVGFPREEKELPRLSHGKLLLLLMHSSRFDALLVWVWSGTCLLTVADSEMNGDRLETGLASSKPG